MYAQTFSHAFVSHFDLMHFADPELAQAPDIFSLLLLRPSGLSGMLAADWVRNVRFYNLWSARLISVTVGSQATRVR
jgi:hypothetical protein